MARKLGMTFVKAFGVLLVGGTVYRQGWSNCRRLFIREGTLISAIDVRDYDGKVSYWTPLQEDLFATDWRILDDQS